LKAERSIISKRCVLQYIPVEIFRASFKFIYGVHIKEEKGGDKTFLSALSCANTYKLYS
jgi:hypothetical protein